MVERGREIKEKKLEGGRQIVVKSGNGVFFFFGGGGRMINNMSFGHNAHVTSSKLVHFF